MSNENQIELTGDKIQNYTQQYESALIVLYNSVLTEHKDDAKELQVVAVSLLGAYMKVTADICVRLGMGKEKYLEGTEIAHESALADMHDQSGETDE